MNPDAFQEHIYNWLSRKELPTSVQKISNLPIALGSDVGLVRKENQDRVACARILNNQCPIFISVVCDGMGGMTDGSACAALAISTFINSLSENRAPNIESKLKSAIKQANDTVYKIFKGEGGSTLSAFAIQGTGTIVGVNVGDSRIYIIQNGKLCQLSKDDTLAGQMPSANEFNYRHNELLQYIGMGEGIEPNLITFPPLESISNILLTSDGLHRIGNFSMESVVKNSPAEGASIARLLSISKWFGGVDNASIILASELNSLIPESQMEQGQIFEIWDNVSGLALFKQEREIPEISNSNSSLAKQKTNSESINETTSSESSIRSSIKNTTIRATKKKIRKRKSKPEAPPNKIPVQIELDEK